MKVLTFHRIMRGYDGICFGLIHFLNPRGIKKVYEDTMFDPRENEHIKVTAIVDKDSITFVEEDEATVLAALKEAIKW